MKAIRNEIDSEVLGGPVFYLEEVDPSADFVAFERGLVVSDKPRYLGCKVPIERIETVQALERWGFNVLEVQFRSTLKMKQRFDVTAHPYVYSPIEGPDREAVMDIVETTFTDDRFSIDPDLPANAGGMRYRRFVEKSISQETEFAFKLANTTTGEIVGFHTYAYQGGREALFYIGGVKAAYKLLGLGAVLNHFALNEMFDRGIRKVTTHQSAVNYPILNLEIGFFGFKVVGADVVLRKLYA